VDSAVELPREYALVETADERAGGAQLVNELLPGLVTGCLHLDELCGDAALSELPRDRAGLATCELRAVCGQLQFPAACAHYCFLVGPR